MGSPGAKSTACASDPNARATSASWPSSRSASRRRSTPGVSISWRAARVPTAPTPTTSADVTGPVDAVVHSPKIGTFELAPTARRGRDAALAAYTREHSHRAGGTEHAEQALEDLHDAGVYRARRRIERPGGGPLLRSFAGPGAIAQSVRAHP